MSSGKQMILVYIAVYQWYLQCQLQSCNTALICNGKVMDQYTKLVWCNYPMTCNLQVCYRKPWVPGGAMGDLLKSYGQYEYLYDERAGLTLALRIRFRVIKYWKMRRLHLLMGKSVLVVDNPEIKEFSKVLMACSAPFWWCILGGESWKLMAYLFMYSFK